MWRWRELLPLDDYRNIITLGEGGTPLLKSKKLGEALGIRNLYFKNDTINPTATFKDRSFSSAVSKARELGVVKAVTFTSGNAGASLAAYASRAEISVTILVSEGTSKEKLMMMLAFGPRIVKLRWTSMEDVSSLLDKMQKELSLYQFVNFLNPFRHEGLKTIAYEICEDLNWMVPDFVIFPIGTGGGIWGAWKGFRELGMVGLVEQETRLPKMIGVQPRVCSPVISAYLRGKEVAEKEGDPSATIAQSIAADAPFGMGTRPLRAMKESGGMGFAVTDDQIIEGAKWLGLEGIFSEPAEGAVVAALISGVRSEQISKDETIVCVIIGSGLKQPTFSPVLPQNQICSTLPRR